jgi:hypothetical protein
LISDLLTPRSLARKGARTFARDRLLRLGAPLLVWTLALVRERPGITKAELTDAAGLSSASIAQNLRRMLDRGEVREEALPSGSTGYRLADGRTGPSASGREGQTSD